MTNYGGRKEFLNIGHGITNTEYNQKNIPHMYMWIIPRYYSNKDDSNYTITTETYIDSLAPNMLLRIIEDAFVCKQNLELKLISIELHHIGIVIIYHHQSHALG